MPDRYPERKFHSPIQRLPLMQLRQVFDRGCGKQMVRPHLADQWMVRGDLHRGHAVQSCDIGNKGRELCFRCAEDGERDIRTFPAPDPVGMNTLDGKRPTLEVVETCKHAVGKHVFPHQPLLQGARLHEAAAAPAAALRGQAVGQGRRAGGAPQDRVALPVGKTLLEEL